MTIALPPFKQCPEGAVYRIPRKHPWLRIDPKYTIDVYIDDQAGWVDVLSVRMVSENEMQCHTGHGMSGDGIRTSYGIRTIRSHDHNLIHVNFI